MKDIGARTHKLVNYINSNYSFRDEYQFVFNKPAPTGKCFCPFHHNTDTPAAKIYENGIYCFVCKRLFGVYDLWKAFTPDRIDEVKGSIILPETSSVSRRIRTIPVDRSLPLSSIYFQILDGQV